MKRPGKRRSSPIAMRLAAHEARIEHRIAHLGVVLQRHLRDRRGIRAARALELARTAPAQSLVPREQLIEHRAILERGVHALAVKGHDGVRGIAEQQHLPAEVPGRGVHGAELSLRVSGELRGRSGSSGSVSANSRLKNVRHRRGAAERGKARRSPRAGRNSVAVKLPSVLGRAISMKPPRGQMCSACRSSAAAAAAGDGELLVVVIEPFLAHAHELRRRRGWRAPPIPRRRWRWWERARTSYVLPAAARRGSVRRCAAGVRAEARLAEAHADAAVARRLLDQHAVELGAADRVDDLVLALPVGLQRARPRARAPCARASGSAAAARAP